MSHNRHKDRDWSDAPNTMEYGSIRVLMDIRDELKKLNSIMCCPNVAKGFRALAKIATRDEKTFQRRVKYATDKRLKRKGAAP